MTQHEQIIMDKTFKFMVEIETTRRNVRVMLNQAVEETFGNDVYFKVGDVKAVSYTHLTLPTTPYV